MCVYVCVCVCTPVCVCTYVCVCVCVYVRGGRGGHSELLRAVSRESLRSNQKGCPEVSVSQEKFPCVVEVREGFSSWKTGQTEASGAIDVKANDDPTHQ